MNVQFAASNLGGRLSPSCRELPIMNWPLSGNENNLTTAAALRQLILRNILLLRATNGHNAYSWKENHGTAIIKIADAAVTRGCRKTSR